MQPSPQSDPAFPLLADALDPDLAAGAFVDMLNKNGFPVTKLHCAIERVRVRRGIKAIIGYRLTGTDRQGRRFDQRAMVALWPYGDADALPDMGGTLVAPSFGPATATLDRISGRAWLFPNDRKIHTIAELLRGPSASIDGQVEIIHYVPEQGCTVRYSHGDSVLFGKTRADRRAAIATGVDRAARDAGDLPIRLARVIHHDPARRILWQEALPGQSFEATDALTSPRLWAPRITTAITAFQNIQPPSGLKRLTSASLAQTLDARAMRTATAMPEFSDAIFGIARALSNACPAPEPVVLSHCDLHPGNLLWDGSSFAIIDWDTAALAPPARDYGSLIAALIHSAIGAGASDHAILAMARSFMTAAPHVAHMPWFSAASLIGERLYRVGTRLKSPSLQARSRLINLAWALLEDDCG
jgi:Phosphotransferase enzyme family